MVINVSIQHNNDGFLPGIILLTQCYYHRKTRLNAMKRFLKKNQNAPRPSEHPPVRGEKMSKRLGGIKGCKLFPPDWGMLRRSRCVLVFL